MGIIQLEDLTVLLPMVLGLVLEIQQLLFMTWMLEVQVIIGFSLIPLMREVVLGICIP